MVRAIQKILAMAVVLAFLMPALAGEENKTTGKIKNVSGTKMQFVMTADRDSKDYTFNIDRDAKIHLANDTAGKLDDLKVGDEVTVTWRKEGNRNLATEVRCKK
jgi:hypothetical protein